MAKRTRKSSQVFLHGLCGAFLAGLCAIAVQFWWTEVNWPVVGICILFGFGLGCWRGERALDFFREILRLS